MELLNAMDAWREADPIGSGDVVAGKDNVPLQGLAPFQPNVHVHDVVEAPHHVDFCEDFSTPKKDPISSTLVSNFCF
jgi:hypothetical protein